MRSGTYRFGASTLALCLVFSFLALESSAQGASAFPEVGTDTYYIPDVEGQFADLATRADPGGFGIGDSTDPTLCYHYQGLARSTGLGDSYMFVTKSGNKPLPACIEMCNTWSTGLVELGFPKLSGCDIDVTDPEDPGELLIVKMASRNQAGERYRSNRIEGGDTETASSPPPAEDTTVTTIVFDGSGDWPNFGHPGGMQLVGDVLVVALEADYDDYNGSESDNLITFIDVSDPESPRLIRHFDPGDSGTFNAGLVAVTELPGGTYLMAITGDANEEVAVFESEVGDLADPNLVWTQKPSYFASGDWPTGGEAHQSLTFLREGGPTGQLYAVGIRNSGLDIGIRILPGGGDDLADLYEVSYDAGNIDFNKVDSRHLSSYPNSEAFLIDWFGSDPTGALAYEVANFAAGSTAYVSPTGELILYATEHENDGPTVDGKNTVKFGEWRHRDMTRPNSPLLDPSVSLGGPVEVDEGSAVTLTGTGEQPYAKAWAQLWADPHFTDRYIVVDYEDRNKDDFDDFKDLDDAPFNPVIRGFSDQASSARVFAPVGCTIRINDDDYGDGNFPGANTITIQGAPHVQVFSDFDDVTRDGGGGDVDDEATSIQFNLLSKEDPDDLLAPFTDCDNYYTAPIGLTWSLSQIPGNDSDLKGNAVSFSASQLDGPDKVSVSVTATHPSDGRQGLALQDVVVVNVAPSIDSVALSDPAGRDLTDGTELLAGVPLSFDLLFDDAGLPDTHTVTVDWGDGTTTDETEATSFVAATGDGNGSLAADHVYASPGTYQVEIEIEDDDGGIISQVETVEVIDAAAAIEDVVASLQDLIENGDDSYRPLIQAALSKLIGNNAGRASNGALDQLEEDNLVAALELLGQAVAFLAEAELDGAPVTDDLIDLTFVAYSIAVVDHQRAVDAGWPPADPVHERLAAAASHIEEGSALLTSSLYLDAVASFGDAVVITASIG